MSLICVPPNELHRWWPQAAALLLPAIERTEGAQSLETVLASIVEGDAHLWLAPQGNPAVALVTTVRRFPTGQRRVRGELCGGRDLALAGELIAAAEAWAREQGIEKADFMGRKGWGRALPGYRETARAFVKDL